MTEVPGQLVTWVTSHALALLVGLIVLWLALRYAKPIIHRFVMTVLRAQQATASEQTAPAAEIAKRAATLEELFGKIVRVVAILLLIVLILSVFDLWPMVAGLGIIAAALTIAGQAIILDYLMGILILIEGQYYNGDWLVVPNAGQNGIQGSVEEVGLRRTTLRDTDGTVHSVSNGEIRIASNMTRVYGVSTVHVVILRAQDLGKALETIDRVYDDMAADAEWSRALLDVPKIVRVTSLTLDGAAIDIRFRVSPDDRWAAASELRQRLALAFASSDVAIGKWDAVNDLSVGAGMATAEQRPQR